MIFDPTSSSGLWLPHLPLSENVGHHAAVYIETYAPSHGLRVGDAIVAATAAESNLTLCTSKVKHFRPIEGLSLRAYSTRNP